MSLIAHISDTHFGTELPDVVAALERDIAQRRPDLVILTGDITQRARPAEFAAARAFMDRLVAPAKLIIPGNHDIPLFDLPRRLVAPYREYSKAFPTREGWWCQGNLGVLALDATSRWRHTRGKLPAGHLKEQLTIARQNLPDGVLIVAAHQPLETAWPQDRENILIDAASTAELLADAKVDLVLSGHVHVPLMTTTHGSFPSLTRHFILGGAGTAVSHRVRPGAPNSYNVIEVADRHIALTLLQYQDKEFLADATKSFKRQEDGWVGADILEEGMSS